MAEKKALDKRKQSMARGVAAAKTITSANTQIAKTNYQELTDDQQKKIIYVKNEDLVDDPKNMEIYGPSEIEFLADTIKDYGFQGTILAYPIDGGKYQIESGHKRRAAGVKAGLTLFPVYPTNPPATENERIQRLLMANLHTRKNNPLITAKVAQQLFEIHREELYTRKHAGLPPEDPDLDSNGLTARDLEMQPSTVIRYRQLLKLIPNLQDLVSTEEYPWSEIASAATLKDSSQEELYAAIQQRSRRDGPDAVTKKWVKAEIGALRLKEDGNNTKNQQSSDQTTVTHANFIPPKLSRAIKTVTEFDFVSLAPENSTKIISELESLQAIISQKIEEVRKSTGEASK